MPATCEPRSFLRSDIRSAIQFSRLSTDEKGSLLRHVAYLTPAEVEELRGVLAA